MTTMLYSMNDLVACEPIQLTPQQTVQSNGLGFGPSSTTSLIKTKVVLHASNVKTFYYPGTAVYVDGRSGLEAWAKVIHEVEEDGKKVRFILVPSSKILLMEHPALALKSE